MAVTVRSYSKVNLGLAIGPPRADGFHALATLYQTIALFDLVTVEAGRAAETRIRLTSNDARVPLDERNTAWKMVERALAALGVTADVRVHIEKRLPVQGGMGAGSANAAAALLGLERELELELDGPQRLRLAAEVGSDVPLFLVGGSVLGSDRGQVVEAVADVMLNGQTEVPCVIALPGVGVSTPLAFRAWDRRFFAAAGDNPERDLHASTIRDTLSELSRTYRSVLRMPEGGCGIDEVVARPEDGATGILPDPSQPDLIRVAYQQPDQSSAGTLANLQGLTREQHHTGSVYEQSQTSQSGLRDDSETDSNTLSALVEAGIANDFEQVVFAQNPLFEEIKGLLAGDGGERALYAALSGSGSALFGLYRTVAQAEQAQQRLRNSGIEAIATTTLPRSLYWSSMFAG